MQIWKLYVALDSGAVDHCVNPKDLPDSIMVVKEDEKRRFVNATEGTSTITAMRWCG